MDSESSGSDTPPQEKEQSRATAEMEPSGERSSDSEEG